jgi:hypothetical protein
MNPVEMANRMAEFAWNQVGRAGRLRGSDPNREDDEPPYGPVCMWQYNIRVSGDNT